jgi:endoglucanase
VEESAPYISRVTNPDGSTTNLVYEIHQYFDSGNKPGNECRGNQIDAFRPVVEYLRKNKRQAMVTEIGGGGPNSKCMPCKSDSSRPRWGP